MRELKNFVKSLQSLGVPCEVRKTLVSHRMGDEEIESEDVSYHFAHEGELWTVWAVQEKKNIRFRVTRYFSFKKKGDFNFKVPIGTSLRPFARKLVEHLKSSKIRDLLSS